MSFFEIREAFRDNIFLIDEEGNAYTYGQVWEMGEHLTEKVPAHSLVLSLVSNDVFSVSCYFALLRRRCHVILMGKHTDPEMLEGMKQTYRPDVIAEGEHVQLCEYPGESGERSAPQDLYNTELALLLSTSGSTGEQKLVRLSFDNLQANCESIAEYLELTEEERPITTLPMEYTYGLSVIHSHAQVGASVILTNRTLFEPAFWDLVKTQGATSMAGVPYTYEMLERLRLRRMDLPKLRTMTQAGGHLSEDLQKVYADWAAETGRRFFVMYGQTEATARMSYIPWDRCREKIGSIGIPVPGGRIVLVNEGEEDVTEPGVSGELCYCGPNVCMGYALCREDLKKEDENRGRLMTGDMACRDEEGYFYITGRKKRFVKLYGKRFSLDRIQQDLEEHFKTPDFACTGDDENGIRVWRGADAGAAEQTAGDSAVSKATAPAPPAEEERILELFRERWGIRENMVHIRVIPEIPRNPSGKILYGKLEEMTETRDDGSLEMTETRKR